MKKFLLVLCVSFMVLSLIGCDKESTTSSFTGVVNEITDDTALIIPNEGEEIRKSGNTVRVSLKGMKVDGLMVGDTVKGSYTGDIMESDPLQVNISSIEIIQQVQKEYSFDGIIKEIKGNSAIVTPNEDEEIRSSGDAVAISIEECKDELVVGSAIRVYYTGEIMESYPLQVHVLRIEKIK